MAPPPRFRWVLQRYWAWAGFRWASVGPDRGPVRSESARAVARVGSVTSVKPPNTNRNRHTRQPVDAVRPGLSPSRGRTAMSRHRNEPAGRRAPRAAAPAGPECGGPGLGARARTATHAGRGGGWTRTDSDKVGPDGARCWGRQSRTGSAAPGQTSVLTCVLIFEDGMAEGAVHAAILLDASSD